MNHDELFKELLYLFFAEFFSLFFPAEAARLDLSSVRFREQELFTDFPEGSLRRPDVIAEARELSGESAGLILFLI